MKFNDDKIDQVLDRVSEHLRTQEMESEQVQDCAERAWEQIKSAQKVSSKRVVSRTTRIENCSDLQALIPDHLAGKLGESRRLLLEDHLSECVPCRRALREAREEARPMPMPAPRQLPWKMIATFATAAMVVLAIGLTQFGVLDDLLPAPSGPRATVESVNGQLFRISAEGYTPLQPGVTLSAGDQVRTARQSGAVLRLRDGSRVEIGERSQLAISETRGGKRINLARGNIIVQAATQREGYLKVQTDDVQVAVKGTVFSVNSGTRGSRVSVIEGQVAVLQGSASHSLRSGQQFSSQPALERVPLEQEIAWSRDAETHLALVRQLTTLGKDLERTFRPELHYTTTLLELAPEGTIIYISIPNISGSLDEARLLFEERVQSNDQLRAWWEEHGAELQPRIDEVVDRIRTLGGHFGEEIAVAVRQDGSGQPSDPLVLAEALDDSALVGHLSAEISNINAQIGEDHLLLVDNPFSQQQGDQQLYLMVQQGVFAASPSIARLQEVAEILQGSANAFLESPFFARTVEAYSQGVGYLLAVDLESLIAPEITKNAKEGALFSQLGIADASYLMVEKRPSGDLTETRAVINFNQTRRGLASWLAQPAPMGTLDFISADAKAAGAFAVKDPVQMVDELFELLQTTNSDGWRELVDFQMQKGINIRQDFAIPLGGEIALALDGPLLPEPSWKVVLEVYDPARLQQTIEWLITEVNQHLAQEGNPGLELLTQYGGGRTFYSLVSLSESTELHYVFVDGYLVAAPNRALLINAIQYRQTGYTLSRSEKFRAKLPAGSQANFSALVYQDVGSMFAPLLEGMTRGEAIPEETRQGLQELASQVESSLFYAYGESDRITLAGTGDLFSGFGLGGGLGGLMGLAAVESVQRQPR